MSNINYNQKLYETIKSFTLKPKILLHSCCAPCSSACIKRLEKISDLTVYFYNPNMDTVEEFSKRKNEEIKLCNMLNIKCITEDYNPQDFYEEIKGLENEKEGGKRCEKCFYIRLKKTAVFAKQNQFDFFATTLTLSPLKNAFLINSIGEKISEELKIKYLCSDFKKQDGYLESIKLSKQYNLYRQNYCGCIYSKVERLEAKNNI